MRSLAFIGCRLIALYFAFMALAELVNMSGMIFFSSQENTQNEVTIYALTATLIASRFLVACLLWIGAESISRKVVGRNVERAAPNEMSGEILQKVLFSAVGLAVVVWSAPELVAAVYKYANLDEFRAKDMEGFRLKAAWPANTQARHGAIGRLGTSTIARPLT